MKSAIIILPVAIKINCAFAINQYDSQRLTTERTRQHSGIKRNLEYEQYPTYHPTYYPTSHAPTGGDDDDETEKWPTYAPTRGESDEEPHYHPPTIPEYTVPVVNTTIATAMPIEPNITTTTIATQIATTEETTTLATTTPPPPNNNNSESESSSDNRPSYSEYYGVDITNFNVSVVTSTTNDYDVASSEDDGNEEEEEVPNNNWPNGNKAGEVNGLEFQPVDIIIAETTNDAPVLISNDFVVTCIMTTLLILSVVSSIA